MVRLMPGVYQMGETDVRNLLPDSMPHRVRLTRGFDVASSEVTRDLFEVFARDTSLPEADRIADWSGADNEISPALDCPVQHVSWQDAILFCNWLSQREKRTPCYTRMSPVRVPTHTGEMREMPGWKCDFDADGYRLPTEAEWEYACRARTTTNYIFGQSEEYLRAYATYSSNLRIPTTPEGVRLPNGWGLYSMHGNVWEWCWDAYSALGKEEASDPLGASGDKADASLRVHRGGGVANTRGDWRSASRARGGPLDRYWNVGFRVVRTTLRAK
jgi:formylglycine-generating enzyme required for sulfatase activity